jgi:GTP-binding protein Era
MNVRMVDLAVESARQSDLIGLVRDATVAAGSGDGFVRDLLGKGQVPIVLILNKIDLMAKPRLLPLIESAHAAFPFVEIVPVSALDGTSVDRLERVLLEHLPEGDALYPADYVTDQPERFFVAEIVREKVLEFTRNELPFSTAVVVDRFEEIDEKGLMRLYCSILVERDSQKGILVGRAGDMVKRVGTAARIDLEQFFQARVYLDLRVKVRSEWREDDRVLDELGMK